MYNMPKIKYLDDSGLVRLSEDLEYRHPSTFTGTREDWENLDPERKIKYKIINFLDDLDHEDIRHPNIFTGTRSEWAALPLDEKKKYLLVCLTDDLEGDHWFLSNQVADGDMNPVTSNAVYIALVNAVADLNSRIDDEVDTLNDRIDVTDSHLPKYIISGKKLTITEQGGT